MRLREATLAFALSAAAAVGACNPSEDSENIATAGIYVEYEVVEQGLATEATARATFWVGDDPGGTYLELTGGDEIEVDGVELVDQGGNPKRYEAQVPVKGAGELYEFVFTRPDEGPYSSLVSTRPQVDLTAPDGETYSREDDSFDVEWDDNDDTGDPIELLVEGDCIDDYPQIGGDDVDDSGSYSVAAGDLEEALGEEGETCEVTVTLERASEGTLSLDLKGTIEGFTTDAATFTSEP